VCGSALDDDPAVLKAADVVSLPSASAMWCSASARNPPTGRGWYSPRCPATSRRQKRPAEPMPALVHALSGGGSSRTLLSGPGVSLYEHPWGHDRRPGAGAVPAEHAAQGG
jgi:hypothetical protein